MAALSPFPPATSAATRATAIARIRRTVAGVGNIQTEGIAEADIPAAVDERIGELGDMASALVERHAPDAPQAIRDEAMVRLIGWHIAREPRAQDAVEAGPVTIRNARDRNPTPNALTNSGAKALLQPWRRRRALPVEESS
ncbi:MAG: hypothetical protein OXH79_03100 [Boseongicola sp.]|nr:hypothetical protein [Boseongicola sp.]